MMITKPGIYVDFDVNAYHADPTPEPSLSQSIAKLLIERSPAHAQAAHPRLSPQDEDEEAVEKYDAAKAIGNAAHAMLIGRTKTIAVGDFDDWRSKEARTFKAEAFAEKRVPILTKHMARAEAMMNAAHAGLDAAGWAEAFSLTTSGHGEVALFWQEDGFWFRSLIDWLAGPARPYDYKTTSLSCAPHMIPTLMASGGWDIQAAMHERGLDVLDPEGRGRRKFRFFAQENEPPYATTPVELTEGVLTMGRKKLQYAIDQWKRCMEAGVWPAYPDTVTFPDLPPWHEQRWLDREGAEADARMRARGQVGSLMGG